jgi:hypothetical protein
MNNQLRRVGVVCACGWTGGRVARADEVGRYGACPKCAKPVRPRDAMMTRRRKIAMAELAR